MKYRLYKKLIKVQLHQRVFFALRFFFEDWGGTFFYFHLSLSIVQYRAYKHSRTYLRAHTTRALNGERLLFVRFPIFAEINFLKHKPGCEKICELSQQKHLCKHSSVYYECQDALIQLPQNCNFCQTLQK